MKETYRVEELFLASIDVIYPPRKENEPSIFTDLEDDKGFNYITVLKKEGEEYIDFQDKYRKISFEEDPSVITYKVKYMVPLSKYYQRDDGKKIRFTRTNAIKKTQKAFFDENQMTFDDIIPEEETTLTQK